MNLVPVIQFCFWLVVFCGHAFSQRYYTFEEACRLGGQTTGACAPKSQQGELTKCVNLDGNAFHAEPSSNGCVNVVLSPVVDTELFVELIGTANSEKINQLNLSIWRAPGRGNAHALMEGSTRLIIIDPNWAKSISAEAYLILGHEAGHHFCQHTLPGFERSPREDELAADRFSGASIKRFEVYHRRSFLSEALEAASRLYSETGRRGYPTRAERIDAIKLGYNSGSPCGSLAPGIAGLSPNPR